MSARYIEREKYAEVTYLKSPALAFVASFRDSANITKVFFTPIAQENGSSRCQCEDEDVKNLGEFAVGFASKARCQTTADRNTRATD